MGSKPNDCGHIVAHIVHSLHGKPWQPRSFQYGHGIRALPAMRQKDKAVQAKTTTTIPVMEEYITVDKQVLENKIHILKTVTEESYNVDIPVIHEGYIIERVPVNEIFELPPPVRNDGDTLIVPVIREVLVVHKRYEVTEEIHLKKEQTITPHNQEITLKSESVEIRRTGPGESND